MGIRLGLCQTRVTRDKGENLRLTEAALRQAADQGANLALLPEMFNCPYENPCFPPLRGARRGGDLAVPGRHGPGAGAVPGRGLCAGAGGGQGVQHLLPLLPQGEELARHRKVHLFDIDVPGGQRFKESDTLAAGNQITVVDTPLGTLGLAICFDIRFAELFRVMGGPGGPAHPGARRLQHDHGAGPLGPGLPDAGPGPAVLCGRLLPRPGREASYVAYGHSLVCNPWGDPRPAGREARGAGGGH